MTALKIFPRKERLYLNDKYYSKGMHMSQIVRGRQSELLHGELEMTGNLTWETKRQSGLDSELNNRERLASSGLENE